MPASAPGSKPRAAPRLYLVTPPSADAAALARDLAPVLAAADVAAVLVRLAPADERSMINHVKALAPAVQDRGVALLLDGWTDLVGRSGADGAHLTGLEALLAAHSSLKPARIAGVGGLTTRHDAMVAGEAGADYVMFGEPDARGQRPSLDAITERVAWWAEVFQPPCVAYAEDLDECVRLAAAGADFIAVEHMIWNDSRGAAAAAAALAARLANAEPVG